MVVMQTNFKGRTNKTGGSNVECQKKKDAKNNLSFFGLRSEKSGIVITIVESDWVKKKC